jgi:RND family efflux transporter MFP subunit
MQTQPSSVRGDAGFRPRIWWLIPLGIALVVLVWAVSGRFQSAEEQAPALQSPPPVPAVKAGMVARGPVSSSLSYSGDIRAVSQVAVVPKASGRIEALLVEVGSPVKRGDVIAELDAATLYAQVSQAKASLAAATAKYSSMTDGPRSEQVGQAWANLLNARERLGAMQDGARGEQLAQARAGLDAAQARADAARIGAREGDVQAAASAADQARANLLTAEARLEQLRQWPTQTEWGAALGAVDAARANFQAAEARLMDVAAGPKAADVQAAEGAVQQARANLDRAQDLENLAKDIGNDTVKLMLATGYTSFGQAEAAVRSAQVGYEAAVERLNLLRSMPLPADLQAAQSAVDAAKGNLMAAEFRVDQMKRGATPEDLSQAQAGVTAAQAGLAAAEARLKQIREGATAEELRQVDAAVAQAREGLALAEKPFTDRDIAQARNAVTIAQQQYSLAADPYTRYDLELAYASVLQAEAALEMVAVALSESVVRSPMDGVVSERMQSLGALVGPTTPLVSIISSDVELTLGVEESQLGRVREGQAADISVAAYPGVVFPAKVAIISPAADPRSRTFQVRVRPAQADSRLKPGMFAQVRIVTEAREGALLIPREAVVTRSGQSSVFVINGDVVQLRPVTLGLTDNGSVEVLSGLDAGEEVVTAGHSDLKDGDKVRR